MMNFHALAIQYTNGLVVRTAVTQCHAVNSHNIIRLKNWEFACSGPMQCACLYSQLNGMYYVSKAVQAN